MKRKVFTIALALFAAASAWAQTTFTIDNLKYTVTDETAKTVELTGYGTWPEGTLDIPATVSYNSINYSVTSIGYNAFYSCSAITQVTIPESVTSIGYDAFRDCSAITQVTIPESVTSIGDLAFYECSALTQVTIGNGVTSIGNDAFYNTALYKNAANWTNNVLYIDNCLIEAKTELSGSYEITADTRLIADYAFYYCSALTQVDIPGSVTSIGYDAFRGCSALTQVNIPDGVKSIGGGAFSSCSALTQVTIGNGVKSIGKNAFYGTALYKNTANWTNNVLYIDNCLIAAKTKLSGSYKIAAGTRLIAGGAFSSCSALTQVNIPNSVTSIGSSAFSYCSALTQVNIPNSVTSIGDEAFYYCKKLTQINVNTANTAYCSENGVLFNKDKTMLMQYPAGKPETVYAIPNGVTSIGSSAFRSCSALTQVDIPGSVTSIGDYAFAGCSALTQVNIPDGVKSIGDYAFAGCSALTQVTWNATNCADLASSDYSPFKSCPITDFTFGDQVKHIPAYLCYGMDKLTKVTIPASVTSIGEEAFSDCSVLAEMIVLATVPPTITAKTFYKINLQVKVSIPEGSKDAYMADENWKWLLELSAGQLSGTCGDNLTWTFTTADSTLTISGTGDMYDYGFSGHPWTNFRQGIKNISIQDGVTSIGDDAFYGCSALTAVYYTGDVAGWCGITFANSDSNPLSYAHNLYIDNTLVTELTIPEGVTEIKDYAFYRCSALTQVNIPDGVKSIGDYAFYYCSALKEMTVKANTPPTLGVYAFNGVSREIPVYVPAEALEDYQAAETWKEFNLQAMQTALHTPSMPESISVYGGMLHNPQGLPVSIYDMQGRMVYSGTAATVSQPAGVYVVRCAGASSKVLF